MKGTVGRLLAATVMIAAVGGAGSAARAAEPLPAPNAIVVKSGDVRITGATVERMTLAMRGVALDEGEPTGPVTAAERRETLQTLLYLHFTVEEARRQRLPLRFTGEITRAEAREAIREILPKPATDADRRLWIDGLLASEALVRAAVDRLPPPSDGALERLWSRQREPGWFVQRQVRAEVVELPNAAKAREALAALRAGESFAAVGARLSGTAPSVFHGEAHLFSGPVFDGETSQPKLLRALLKAAPQTLVGPLADDGGWFVARVVEVISGRARIPLPQVRARLMAEIEAKRAATVSDRVGEQLLRRWVPRTTCVRPYVVRRLCGRVVARPLG